MKIKQLQHEMNFFRIGNCGKNNFFYLKSVEHSSIDCSHVKSEVMGKIYYIYVSYPSSNYFKWINTILPLYHIMFIYSRNTFDNKSNKFSDDLNLLLKIMKKINRLNVLKTSESCITRLIDLKSHIILS